MCAMRRSPTHSSRGKVAAHWVAIAQSAMHTPTVDFMSLTAAAAVSASLVSRVTWMGHSSSASAGWRWQVGLCSP